MTAAATPSTSDRSSGAAPKTRHLLLVIVLTSAWCALWGEVTAANVLSGVAVSCGLVLYGVKNRTGMDGVTSGRVGFGALVRLTLFVAWDLVKSTVEVAKEVITPDDRSINEAIIAVDLPPEAEHHLLLLVVAITVTPGTAVIDTDLENRKLYLHILHYDGRDEIEAHVKELVRLAFAAFPAGPGSAIPEGDPATDQEGRS